MGDYMPAQGDRVRVVLEGEVSEAGPEGFGNGDYFILSDRERECQDSWCTTTVNSGAKFLVSVEKIEPPVTVFKPGDVVRDLEDGTLRAVIPGGWVNLSRGGQVFKNTGELSSKTGELVDLSK